MAFLPRRWPDTSKLITRWFWMGVVLYHALLFHLLCYYESLPSLFIRALKLFLLSHSYIHGDYNVLWDTIFWYVNPLSLHLVITLQLASGCGERYLDLNFLFTLLLTLKWVSFTRWQGGKRERSALSLLCGEKNLECVLMAFILAIFFSSLAFITH